jgi:hypothetical protein
MTKQSLNTLKIISEKITREELKRIADEDYGFYVKAVVDIENEIIAIGGELHSDEERLLLENGSLQDNLWGINILLENEKHERVEFDSMINIRPRQGNRSKSVEDSSIREKIISIVNNLLE